MSSPTTLDLEQLTLAEGGSLLLEQALAAISVGRELEVFGRAPELSLELRAWARAQGHEVIWPTDSMVTPGQSVARVVRGGASTARWSGAEQAGRPDAGRDGLSARPPASWGLAPRGALVEAGGPELHFALDQRDEIWSDEAGRIYGQAAAAQWDPATAVDWNDPFRLAPEVERAVVQVMTYLIENEHAALLVPARFLGQVHPHFREVMQVLAVQVADEARHVEIFTRRALLRDGEMGLSTNGGRASLGTLFEEPDFAVAHFLLSVLGEGTFLHLLSFLEVHAPDPVTRRVAHLARVDEARHVAFGMSHVEAILTVDPSRRSRLSEAIGRRHSALSQTAGLNEEVQGALVLLAAGGRGPQDIARGYTEVEVLRAQMEAGRRRRLRWLGWSAAEATELAELHTRNFM